MAVTDDIYKLAGAKRNRTSYYDKVNQVKQDKFFDTLKEPVGDLIKGVGDSFGQMFKDDTGNYKRKGAGQDFWDSSWASDLGLSYDKDEDLYIGQSGGETYTFGQDVRDELSKIYDGDMDSIGTFLGDKDLRDTYKPIDISDTGGDTPYDPFRPSSLKYITEKDNEKLYKKHVYGDWSSNTGDLSSEELEQRLTATTTLNPDLDYAIEDGLFTEGPWKGQNIYGGTKSDTEWANLQGKLIGDPVFDESNDKSIFGKFWDYNVVNPLKDKGGWYPGKNIEKRRGQKQFDAFESNMENYLKPPDRSPVPIESEDEFYDEDIVIEDSPLENFDDWEAPSDAEKQKIYEDNLYKDPPPEENIFGGSFTPFKDIGNLFEKGIDYDPNTPGKQDKEWMEENELWDEMDAQDSYEHARDLASRYGTTDPDEIKAIMHKEMYGELGEYEYVDEGGNVQSRPPPPDRLPVPVESEDEFYDEDIDLGHRNIFGGKFTPFQNTDTIPDSELDDFEDWETPIPKGAAGNPYTQSETNEKFEEIKQDNLEFDQIGMSQDQIDFENESPMVQRQIIAQRKKDAMKNYIWPEGEKDGLQSEFYLGPSEDDPYQFEPMGKVSEDNPIIADQVDVYGGERNIFGGKFSPFKDLGNLVEKGIDYDASTPGRQNETDAMWNEIDREIEESDQAELLNKYGTTDPNKIREILENEHYGMKESFTDQVDVYGENKNIFGGSFTPFQDIGNLFKSGTDETEDAITPGLGGQPDEWDDQDEYRSFKYGGTYKTSGPEKIIVGDNLGGEEIVSVEPLKNGQPIDNQLRSIINTDTNQVESGLVNAFEARIIDVFGDDGRELIAKKVSENGGQQYNDDGIPVANNASFNWNMDQMYTDFMGSIGLGNMTNFSNPATSAATSGAGGLGGFDPVSMGMSIVGDLMSSNSAAKAARKQQNQLIESLGTLTKESARASKGRVKGIENLEKSYETGSENLLTSSGQSTDKLYDFKNKLIKANKGLKTGQTESFIAEGLEDTEEAVKRQRRDLSNKYIAQRDSANEAHRQATLSASLKAQDLQDQITELGNFTSWEDHFMGGILS